MSFFRTQSNQSNVSDHEKKKSSPSSQSDDDSFNLQKTDEAKKNISINYPAMVNKDVIQPNGKLLNDATITMLTKLGLKPGQHYHRQKSYFKTSGRVNAPFSITCIEKGKLYADYRNVKEDKSAPLGSGSFAIVKLAQDLSSGELIVSKVLKTKKKGQVEQFRRSALAELSVLQDLGRARSGLIERMSKEGLAKFQMYMEMAKGSDLYTLICDDRLPNNSNKLMQIALNMLNAAKELNDLGYVHRDIKIENMMVDLDSLKVTIIDFNLTIKMDKDGNADDGIRCGSFATIAPEILAGSSVYSASTDVYALGVTLRALLFGKVLRDKDERVIDQSLGKCSTRYTDDGNAVAREVRNHRGSYEIPYDIYKLIKHMRRQDPAKRPTLNEAIEIFKKHLEPEKAPEQEVVIDSLSKSDSETLSLKPY